MTAWWAASVAGFLSADPKIIEQELTHIRALQFASVERQQIRSWASQIDVLRVSLGPLPHLHDCRLLLEFPLLRLGRRIDAVLVTPSAIVVLEFKDSQQVTADAMRQLEDYALDLRDFHAACRHQPIIPILVTTQAPAQPQTWPLVLAGVTPPLRANAANLGDLLGAMLRPGVGGTANIDVNDWEHADYRPVPTIIDAARTLYSQHSVAEIRSARADARNLAETSAAIQTTIDRAAAEHRHVVVFVTGIPGAGKTLCGLNIVFGAGAQRALGAAFLTGNPSLVHVFREALARDQHQNGHRTLKQARDDTRGAIQRLPDFRDHYVQHTHAVPSEHVVVIDEAQRCWSTAHAVMKTRDKPAGLRLTTSEPAHLLDIMCRHRTWAVLVCLVGGGQEIHTGEGGVAEWGSALAQRPEWQVLAADLLGTADPRQRLPNLPGLTLDPLLHLTVPIRSISDHRAAAWVEAVLTNNQAVAAALARDAPPPFRLTRDLASLRTHLRRSARGLRRAGLVASSGAARLRAEGLGAELPHMDAGAVAHWFLDRYPADIRASDALELLATEFSCQGLELDHVGLCWDGDLIRQGSGWRARKFRGTRWQLLHGSEAISNLINTYRVLLTRARYETVIFVPRGDAADPTRTPAEFEAVADFLQSCGVQAVA
jgi:hypothetical protein